MSAAGYIMLCPHSMQLSSMLPVPNAAASESWWISSLTTPPSKGPELFSPRQKERRHDATTREDMNFDAQKNAPISSS